jgi:hypothetical protein
MPYNFKVGRFLKHALESGTRGSGNLSIGDPSRAIALGLKCPSNLPL